MEETESGVYIELEFLDTFMMFGQGFFAFLIFGLDQKMVIEPFLRRWVKCLCWGKNAASFICDRFFLENFPLPWKRIFDFCWKDRQVDIQKYKASDETKF